MTLRSVEKIVYWRAWAEFIVGILRTFLYCLCTEAMWVIFFTISEITRTKTVLRRGKCFQFYTLSSLISFSCSKDVFPQAVLSMATWWRALHLPSLEAWTCEMPNPSCYWALSWWELWMFAFIGIAEYLALLGPGCHQVHKTRGAFFSKAKEQAA